MSSFLRVRPNLAQCNLRHCIRPIEVARDPQTSYVYQVVSFLCRYLTVEVSTLVLERHTNAGPGNGAEVLWVKLACVTSLADQKRFCYR